MILDPGGSELTKVYCYNGESQVWVSHEVFSVRKESPFSIHSDNCQLDVTPSLPSHFMEGEVANTSKKLFS